MALSMLGSTMARSAALGFATGLRSVTPLAILSLEASIQGTRTSFLPNLRFGKTLPLTSRKVSTILGMMAIGELIADKLPTTPARTKPQPLTGRAVIGGTVGAIIAYAYNQPPAYGGAIGTTAAVAGSFAGYSARARLVKALGVPDPAVALVEDALAVGMSFTALRIGKARRGGPYTYPNKRR